jgi:hypothetical protein
MGNLPSGPMSPSLLQMDYAMADGCNYRAGAILNPQFGKQIFKVGLNGILRYE